MSGTQVRQSIVRSSVLPTEHKQTQVKQEIIASGENVDLGLGGAGGFGAGGEFGDGDGSGAGAGGAGGAGLAGLSSLKLHSTVSATGLHEEIKTSTTVRPSIVRSSVLPTINGGVKVLKTIFGGTKTLQATAEESAQFGAGAGEGAGAGFDLGAGAGEGAGAGFDLGVLLLLNILLELPLI